MAETRVLNEQEIKDAIAALNRSTESITRYNDILKQQRAALDRIVSAAKEGVDAQATLAKDQTEKWKSQRQELILEVSNLRGSFVRAKSLLSLDSAIITVSKRPHWGT